MHESWHYSKNYTANLESLHWCASRKLALWLWRKQQHMRWFPRFRMMIKKEKELKKMEYGMHVTGAAHYVSSEFYSEWDIKLQYASYKTGMHGASGGVFSKLAWKTITQNYPRLGPVAAATAAMMSLFAGLVNMRSLPYSLAVLHQIHFTKIWHRVPVFKETSEVFCKNWCLKHGHTMDHACVKIWKSNQEKGRKYIAGFYPLRLPRSFEKDWNNTERKSYRKRSERGR